MTTGTFTMSFLGRDTEFTYTVSTSYEVEVDFTVAQVPYTFTLTRWSGRGMKKFLPLFFEREPRDQQQFGSMVEEEDSVIYNRGPTHGIPAGMWLGLVVGRARRACLALI